MHDTTNNDNRCKYLMSGKQKCLTYLRYIRFFPSGGTLYEDALLSLFLLLPVSGVSDLFLADPLRLLEDFEEAGLHFGNFGG